MGFNEKSLSHDPGMSLEIALLDLERLALGKFVVVVAKGIKNLFRSFLANRKANEWASPSIYKNKNVFAASNETSISAQTRISVHPF